MADITVRKLRFEFSDTIDRDAPAEMLSMNLAGLGLSLTMPYLEPYLIRTMREAIPTIRDPLLAEDARRFSQQEGHHYRNHQLLNEHLRSQFDPETAAELRAIEARLDASYQRFTKHKSLRFNLAYAEGFEAMTCAGALTLAELGAFEGRTLTGGDIWAWHMAEEIEHRTVAFDVYAHLVGSYPYRIVFGTWAQLHYLSYVWRFHQCMARAIGRELPPPHQTPLARAARERYFRTFRPSYDPARIEIPAGVDALLARFTALANEGRASA